MFSAHTKFRSNAAGAAWISLAALAVMAPMFVHGFSCGNDLTFHMQSWMEAAQHWRAHEWFPRWTATAAWGAGEPRFVFYPPLSWLLGGLLGAVAGWPAAPYLFAFVVLCAAGWSMRGFAVPWTDARTATMAACLYVANPYLLFVLYTRGALAEMLAAALLPWLLAEALRPRIRVWSLALPVALLWLTNAPAAVMGCYALALLLVVRCVRGRSFFAAKRGALAALLGIMLAAGYILPAAYERRWVSIAQVISGAYDFHANFLFGGTGEAAHDLVLHHASWAAVALLAIALPATAWLAAKKRAEGTALLTLTLAILLLLLPVSAFAWAHLPQLRFLQFPWRLLAVLAPIAAFGAAAWLQARPRALAICAVAFASTASIAICYTALRQECDPEDTPRGIRAQFTGGEGFEGTDEYVPAGADPDDLRPDPQHQGYPPVWLYRDDTPETDDQPESEDAGDDGGSNAPEDHVRMASMVEIEKWFPEEKLFRVHASRKAVALLQLEDYPAWRATLDGRPIAKNAPATSGQMQLAIPEGDHTVSVVFAETSDRLLGDAIACIAVIFWFAATRRDLSGTASNRPGLMLEAPPPGVEQAMPRPVSSSADAG